MSCPFYRGDQKWRGNLEETSGLENYLRTSWRFSVASHRGSTAVRRAWIFFKGEAFLEPGTECFPCVPEQARSQEGGCAGLLALRAREEFWFLLFVQKVLGSGSPCPPQAVSDPHGKPLKGPGERSALDTWGAPTLGWGAAPSRVPACIAPRALRSLALPATCWAGRGCRRAQNSTDRAVTERAPVSCGLWRFCSPSGVPVPQCSNPEFWPGPKTSEFSLSTPCSRSHAPYCGEKPAPHLWPVSGPWRLRPRVWAPKMQRPAAALSGPGS